MRAMKSKTIWFSFLLVVFGAVYDNFSYLQSLISDKYYGISFMVVGVITAILRFITTCPINEK
jgi:hypothetical protein